MGFLSKKKNKKFNYQPRYYQHDGDGSPFSIEHKFDKFRYTVGENKNLKGKFKTAWNDLRTNSDKKVRFRLLIIVSILVLLFLYIIEFDLSIFYR